MSTFPFLHLRKMLPRRANLSARHRSPYFAKSNSSLQNDRIPWPQYYSNPTDEESRAQSGYVAYTRSHTSRRRVSLCS